MKNSRLTSLLLCFGVAMLVIGIAGCSLNSAGDTSEEKAVRIAIGDELEPLKDPANTDNAAFLDDLQIEDLEVLKNDYGVDIADLIKHLFRGFKYTINEVEFDGKHATAHMAITSLDTTMVVDEACKLAQNDENARAIADLYARNDSDAKRELVQFTLQLIYEVLDGGNDMISHDIDMTLTKQEGEWVIDPDSLKNLFSTMLSGIDLADVWG